MSSDKPIECIKNEKRVTSINITSVTLIEILTNNVFGLKKENFGDVAGDQFKEKTGINRIKRYIIIWIPINYQWS
jgi:hypothetical protein